MDLNLTSTLLGFVFCAAVLVITVTRQRRFELTDVGSVAAAFLAGKNVPAAVFLCGYAIWPDPGSVATKLHGLEGFVSFAGLCLLLLSLASFLGLCSKAYMLDEEAKATELNPAREPVT